MSLVSRKSDSVPLSNGVTEFRNPSFDNRISWMGWTFVGATTLGGAYQGYRSDMALRWTGWERKPDVRPIANAALGAFTGLASGLLLTWLTGGSAPPVTSDNAAQWLDHLDDRLVLTGLDTLHPGTPLTVLRAVPRTLTNR